jgi:ubiquinone/menaquinone biosynthesis C-methylase UbiE
VRFSIAEVWSTSGRRSRSGQIQTHEELFTSGAYVSSFQPSSASNPFAADYERKRSAVIASVAGVDKQVLDLGGGMGRMSVPLSTRHFVTLTDLSPQMLDLARPYAGERLKLEVADARHLTFAESSFDYVLAIDLLPHIPVPEELLAEAKRVLRPGGSLIIDCTSSVPWWTLAYPRYLGRKPHRWVQIWRSGGVLPEWSSRVKHHRRAELLSFLSEAGFQIRSLRSFGPRACPKWHLAVAVKP